MKEAVDLGYCDLNRSSMSSTSSLPSLSLSPSSLSLSQSQEAEGSPPFCLLFHPKKSTPVKSVERMPHATTSSTTN